MASTSTQTVRVAETKPSETAQPRPAPRPADKPFRIKIQNSIPA